MSPLRFIVLDATSEVLRKFKKLEFWTSKVLEALKPCRHVVCWKKALKVMNDIVQLPCGVGGHIVILVKVDNVNGAGTVHEHITVGTKRERMRLAWWCPCSASRPWPCLALGLALRQTATARPSPLPPPPLLPVALTGHDCHHASWLRTPASTYSFWPPRTWGRERRAPADWVGSGTPRRGSGSSQRWSVSWHLHRWMRGPCCSQGGHRRGPCSLLRQLRGVGQPLGWRLVVVDLSQGHLAVGPLHIAPVKDPDFWVTLVASCLCGALPPVDLCVSAWYRPSWPFWSWLEGLTFTSLRVVGEEASEACTWGSNRTCSGCNPLVSPAGP